MSTGDGAALVVYQVARSWQRVPDHRDRAAAQREGRGAFRDIPGTVSGSGRSDQVGGLGEGDLEGLANRVTSDLLRRAAD